MGREREDGAPLVCVSVLWWWWWWWWKWVGVWVCGRREVRRRGREIALAPLTVGCFSFGAGGGWCPC